MTELVDAHTHVLLPPAVARRIRDVFEQYLTSELAYPVEPEAALERLHGEGVRTIWSLPYAHRAGTARRFNVHSAEAAAAVADGPVAVVAGATVHPDEDDPAAVVVEAVDDLGLQVLKLHCSVGRFDLDDPRLTEVFEVCADRQVPVVVHLGSAIDGTTAADEVRPLASVAGGNPDVIFIAAHVGHPSTTSVLEVMRAHANVWADLTPVVDSPVAVPADALQEHHDRLLFGSDAPNTALDVGYLHRWLRGNGLPPEAVSAICGDNARRLLEARSH